MYYTVVLFGEFSTIREHGRLAERDVIHTGRAADGRPAGMRVGLRIVPGPAST